MEISKTRIAGHEIDVLFTGTYYYFWSSYCGVIATAKRDGEFKEGKAHFIITTGNQHCLGGSLTDCTVEAAVKRFITKAEQKYVPTDVTYESKQARLDLGTLDIKFIEYGN